MLPALSYWTIVLEPPAPVESAPLPYSTKYEPFSNRDRIGSAAARRRGSECRESIHDAMFDSLRRLSLQAQETPDG